jgi:hypothetical protein
MRKNSETEGIVRTRQMTFQSDMMIDDFGGDKYHPDCGDRLDNS